MANLQNILGTMLATGMGGRSGLGMNEMGSVLGSTGLGAAPMDTGNPRSRGLGIGPVAGLGALGYLAYKAYQERQRNTQAAGRDVAPQPAQPGGSPWGGQQIGGILGSLFGGGAPGGAGAGAAGGSFGDRLSQMFQGRGAPPAGGDDEGAYPALAMEDQQALMLIRAMITAANADGEISPDERQRILAALDEAGGGPEEKRLIEQELDRPQPIDTLLQSVSDRQTAEQVYTASLMAIGQATEEERAYLQYLASRLRLDPQWLQQVHRAA